MDNCGIVSIFTISFYKAMGMEQRFLQGVEKERVENQSRMLINEQRAGRNTRKAWHPRSQGNRVSLKQGVINSVKCHQKIMQVKNESVSWQQQVTSGLEVDKEAEYSWRRKAEDTARFTG